MKINVRKTKSLKLEVIDGEEVTLGNEKIDQVNSFIHLGSIFSKDDGSSEDAKSRITKAQGIFFKLKKAWKNRRISLKNKIRILDATVMTMVKNISEAWALQKTEDDLWRMFSKETAYGLFWAAV